MLAKILYRLCHTKYVLPCSSQSFALLGFGVKSGTILHHMPFQAFNTHLLIHKAYLLQCASIPTASSCENFFFLKTFPCFFKNREGPNTCIASLN